MAEKQIPNENRLLALFKRLQKMNINHCPNFENIISPAQLALLEEVANHPGCGVQDVAENLYLSAPTVSVGVSKLEERGLVERKPDPADRRAVKFFITDAGKSLHKEFNQARLEKFRRLLSGLEEKDQNQLLGLLARALEFAEEGD